MYVSGGGDNDDGAGNPLVVNLLVFTMQGAFPRHLVPFSAEYAPETWSEIPAV